MRNAGLEEAQARIKTAGRNINNFRYADDTTLMAKSEEELKSLFHFHQEAFSRITKYLLTHLINTNSDMLVLILIIQLRCCLPGFSTEMYSFSFVINIKKYLVGIYFEIMYLSYFSSELPLTNLASIGDSCLKQLVL